MSGTVHGSSPTPYVLQVVDLLWPGGSASVEHRPRRLHEGERAYLPLPRMDSPAMLVPLASRAITSTALREAKTGGVQRQRRLLRLLAGGVRLGLGAVAPTRVVVRPGPGGSLLDLLSERIGGPVHASIPGSPPRANRKPVLHVIDAAGRTVGFAKVGVNDLTRRLVAVEAEALTALASEDLRSLTVPRVLLSEQWAGLQVMLLQPLRATDEQRIVPADVVRAMVEVADLGTPTADPRSASPYLARLRSRIQDLDPTTVGPALLSTLEQVVADAPDRPLALGAWHGDWTPWNQAMGAGGLLVWDWERFEHGVPRGFDALHHRLQSAVVRGGQQPGAAAEAMVRAAGGLLEPFGVSREDAAAVALLYLVEIAVRYSGDRQQAAGGSMADVQQWLLPVLSESKAWLADG